MVKRIGLTLVVAIVLIVPVLISAQQQLQKTAINFPTRSGASWPMFIAKEGGYYAGNGLDVELVFGSGPLGVAKFRGSQSTLY